MKKIPGACWIISAILMVLSAASFAAESNEVILQLDNVTDGYYINLPSFGTQTLNVSAGVTTFSVYDDGGKDDEYSSGVIGCLVINAPAKKLLKLTGAMDANQDYAYLAVYEGNSTSSSYSFYETGYFSDITQADSYDIGAVSVMTICFESTDDAYGSYGLDLMVTVINGNAVEVKTATGGKIEVGSGVAVNGSTVTVTATPSAGYVFAGLNITDLEDGTVAATATVVGNKATFTMPNKDVNVEPVFSAVTYGSNGCLSGDVYFHLDCDDSGSNPACELSQISTDSPSSDDYHCWYRTDGTNSEGVWVALKAYSNVELSLASNLDLGGYDGSVCRMTFRPISIASLEGNGKIIDGLCFVTSGNAGFVSELNGYNRSYSNVVFTNAYVEGAKAGVLAPASSQGVDVSKVTVDGATVIGDDAGGVVGDFYGFQANYASVSEIIVKNISVIASSAGGALAACGDVVFNGNSFEFSNNTIQAASTATGIVNLGGVMGSYGNDNSSRISTFSLTGTTIKNESSASLANMGGLFGYFPDIGAYLMGSAVLNISESSFEGTISGGHNVGGLIGKAAVSSSNLNISNTYSVGDLIGSGEVNRDTLGYIVGNVYYNGSPVTVRGTITNNYHFGSDAVKLGIGSYTESNWLKGSDYVYGNVRNAGSNFTANGELSLYTYTTGCGGVSYIDFFAPGSFVDLYEPQNPVRNGIAADDDMKSDKFAALLNKNTEYEYTWSRVTGKNGGLPILSGTNNNYVILVYLDNGLNFSTTELSTYGFREYHYEYCADGGNNGWPTYAMVGFTNENGQLSKGFVDSVNAVIEGMANDEHNPRFLSLVDADNPRSRIKLSVESAFGRGDNLKLKTAFKFNVVYQYCDDDPSVAATTCENIEDVNDKTFIFMSPRVNYFMTDFSLENTIVPMLSILNDPVELQYNVEYQDASGNSVNVGHTNDGLSGFRLASSIIDDSYSNVADVKNIVLKYWPNGQPGSQSIIVKNPSAAKFYVTMASDAVDGATHEVVSKVSTINGNGVADEVSVPYSRYLKATDFVCKTGYACDTYAVSFSVTERTSCTDAQPSVIPPNYVENNNFATVDEILSSVDGGCIKATWVVEGLQPGAEVDLVNVLLADLTKNKAANPFDEMEIAVTPKFELITYNVTFDIGGTEQITDGSIPDIQDYEIYVEDNLNAPISYNLEAQTKALPMLYAVTQNYSDANTTAGKMYSSVWTTKSDKARCVLGKGDCADYASSYNQFSASLLESVGDDIKQVEGEDPALELYPVWAAGSANPVSHVVVDCDGDLACKDGDVFTLVLTQIVSMGGKEYVFEHRSARGADDLGGPSIPLPQGAGGEFKFAISAHVKAGYSIDNDGYYFEDNNSKSYDKEPFVYKSPSQDPVKIYYKGWSYSLNEYTVNFDLQSLTYAVLGKNWNASKENMDVSSDHHELSRVYVMDDANPLSPDFGKADWTPVLDENDPNYFVDNELTSDLLSHVNPLTSEFTLYPKVTGRPLGTGKIVVKEYDEYGNLLPDASSYHGNVVLKQKVSDEEDAQTFKQTSSACDIDLIDTDGNVTGSENVHCLYIPNVDDTLTFEVSFEPKKGYAIKSIDAAFLWQDPTGGDPEEKAGFGFKATDTDTTLVINPSTMARPGMYINVMYISKAYRLAFNENVGSSEAKAFVGTQGGLIHDWHVDELSVDSDGNWEPYITYFDTDDNKTFPKIYYRVGYCSDGYTFDPDDATNGVYTELDNDFIKKYNELGKTGEIVLYAHWKSCDNKYYTVTSPDLKYGTMSLLRHSDSYYLNMNSEREYPITAGGLKIPYVKNANNEALDVFFDEFRFEGKGDYDQLYFGKLDFLYYRAKGSDSWVSVEKDSDEKIEKYGLNNASVYDYFEVNADMEVSVRFGKHFLANASNDEVFFGPNWVWDGLYGIGDVVDDKAFSAVPDVGRAGACVVGWGEPIKDADYLVLFDDIDAMIDASAFYAIWNDTKLGGTVGAHLSFNPMDPNLLQQIGCDTTTYTIISTLKQDEPMLILTQTVGDSVFSHWVGESGLKVPAYLKNMKFSADVEHFDNYAAKAIYVMDTQGNVLDTVAPGEPFEIKGNTVIKVDLGKGDGSSIHVSLNENSDDPIYFGNDWTDEISYEGGDSVVLPTIVYNAEKCLAGWAIDPTSEELLKVLDKDLFDELQAKSRATGVALPDLLYAKWTTNLDSCAGDFMKLAVEQENGSVWFAESDKDKTVERRFTEDGTMFVPMELNGRNFRVRAMGADTSVYVLDSLVVLRDGKTDTVLHEGDYMPEILDNVTLKAYFGWKNKTDVAFVKKHLTPSGSMFQLSFTASNFEVRRRVSARVKVLDEVSGSVVINTALGDSIEMGFKKDFVFRMDKPGDYKLILTLKDKTDSIVEYKERFSVSPVISSIAVDSWQMLSLSAVDMSSITWDGDQIFYWWDEHGTGEFWQYRQLTKDDSLVGTRGVWYNSLEGRPLPLNFDVKDEGEDFVWKMDRVNSGWNMVANPHGWSVNLFANNPDAIKDVDEESEIIFWSWNAETGGYDPVLKDIGPYEAVWAQVSKKTKWKVSAAPVFNTTTKAAEKARTLARAKTKERWTLQAKLADKNGKQDYWNVLGAGLNPVAADKPPEGMGDHVNLMIVEGKRALAKSIKEASDEMEWTIALSASSDRIGYLTLDGIDGVKAYGYRVFVTVDGNTTEMQDGVPLTVYLKSAAKTATVRVAPSAKVVAENTLKGLRMARLGNRLQVSFDASGLAGTNARVDILDMKGHVMSTVTAKTLEGSNALVLDAPQSGLYMLRVRAGSEQQVKKVLVR
ncbi:T9SS type A sorting domain-containing protein [Fibrobacter sp.]|uniref:InlB B-repeat-containing protein n=1 Tax=Fibrobacter sp. TaxID=35828 RepID=UPI00386A79CA